MSRRKRQVEVTVVETALVLAATPERVRLRELTAALDAKRDQIGDLDLEIETLRETLITFESQYQARLAQEHQELKRIDAYVRHLERWADLFTAKPRGETFTARARRAEQRRARDVRASAAWRARADAERREDPLRAEVVEPAALPWGSDRDAALKAVYRRLARKFHPDLARTEDEHLKFGQMMARINSLYRTKDLERLAALEEQAKGGEVDDPELDADEQIELLEARLGWFETVLANLRDELIALEQSATCQLMRNVEQARLGGRDLVEELRGDLRDRVERAYDDIRDAAHRLESRVARFNRENATVPERRDGARSVERVFDPFADKSLIRLGLAELETAHVSKAARDIAARYEALADEAPAQLRVLLMAHASELSPFPLAGLESYEHIAQRLTHLQSDEEEPVTFEELLVQLDTWVEFGVKRATERVAYVGLRFRHDDARMAVPVALARAKVRREFTRLLAVLGEHVRCGGCGQDVYAVPLYRTRGLDDLRANVCPSCGATHSSYWMPKGKDVQAVLNPAYLDYEIVTEWTFQLAHLSVAMQLLPIQVETLTVGDLKKRFVEATLERHDLEVTRSQVALVQGGKKLAEKTPLAELEEHAFVVRFAEGAKVNERDALEMIRHRIRNRFKA